MASVRACDAGDVRRVTCHSKSPPRRMNGRRVRSPSEMGGRTSARTLAKWQSVFALVQSCPTESSESRMEGTRVRRSACNQLAGYASLVRLKASRRLRRRGAVYRPRQRQIRRKAAYLLDPSRTDE
eukprot:6195576-Pleurochrysis_carterae.AAC.1